MVRAGPLRCSTPAAQGLGFKGSRQVIESFYKGFISVSIGFALGRGVLGFGAAGLRDC